MLLKTARAGDRITKSVSGTCRRVTFGEKRKDTVDLSLLFHDGLAELVDLVCRISQPVRVGHIVEELLCVQRPTQEKGEVSIRSFDNESDEVNGIGSGKSTLVHKTIFLLL